MSFFIASVHDNDTVASYLLFANLQVTRCCCLVFTAGVRFHCDMIASDINVDKDTKALLFDLGLDISLECDIIPRDDS
ncbi:hypothetical protein NC653_028111 [Populus alba x Populus x berolinensis]|uniref:Uncharacterized protein n=1 Tax=Populus alba x Populus x berolinensis TaxID=444605 RepID=A0AAD6M752_9ROSI|nr:hypothetical protein NC653_028111 [Populus alba x Populus x berolinensis]